MGKPGQIALLASLVSIVISVYLVNTPKTPRYPVGGASRVEEAISRMPIDTEATARIEWLQPRLAALTEAPAKAEKPVDLALFGYRKIVPPAAEPAAEPAKAPDPEPYKYVVSMTYVSADRRFAVINGRFYREGSDLPGGERVVAISPNAVRVEADDLTRSLEIAKEPITFSKGQGVIESEIIKPGDRKREPLEARIADATEN